VLLARVAKSEKKISPALDFAEIRIDLVVRSSNVAGMLTIT
jgi:hypothetical protein